MLFAFYLSAQINNFEINPQTKSAHFNPVISFDCQVKTAVTVVVSLLRCHKMHHNDHDVCERKNNLLLLSSSSL
jgi:hypothetical protein